MTHASSETRLALALVALALLVGGAGAELVTRVFEARVEAVGAAVLAGANEGFRAQQAAEVEKLGATLDALLASRELRAAFERRDREGLQRLAAPILEALREREQVSHWYFVEPGPEPRVFLRVHRPGLYGDVVERTTLRRAADGGVEGAGLELGRTAFALRVVRPWVVEGRLLGYMELAEDVDRFLATMKNRTGDDYGLLVPKRFIDEQAWRAVLGPRATTWDARPDVLVVEATELTGGLAGLAGPDADVDRLPESGRFLGEVERAGRVLVHGAFPIADAGGRRVAALHVVHDFTVHHAAVRGGRWQAFGLLVLLALAGSAAAIGLVHRLAFRPMRQLRERLERPAPPGPDR